MVTERIQLDNLPTRGINSYICTINGFSVYIPFKKVNYLHKIEFYIDVDVDFLSDHLYIRNKEDADFLDFLEIYDKPVNELFAPFIKPNQDKKVSHSLIKKRNKNKGYKCCYCECELTAENYTREHVIPRRVGGKIIRPCCKDCNFEKGGLMLQSYIQLLNLKLLEESGHSLRILQTKIKNANLLAIELKLNN